MNLLSCNNDFMSMQLPSWQCICSRTSPLQNQASPDVVWWGRGRHVSATYSPIGHLFILSSFSKRSSHENSILTNQYGQALPVKVRANIILTDSSPVDSHC